MSEDKELDANEVGPDSVEVLKSFLNYDTDTGKFTWKVNAGKAKIGELAGYVQKNGTRKIRINNKFYLAHNLAIYFNTGVYPESRSVTFKNDRRDDTRIENLEYRAPKVKPVTIKVSKKDLEEPLEVKDEDDSGDFGFVLVGDVEVPVVVTHGPEEAEEDEPVTEDLAAIKAAKKAKKAAKKAKKLAERLALMKQGI